MENIVFVTGGLFIVTGICIYIIAYFTCCQIVRKTSEMKERLKLSEIHSRYRLQKWRKLKYLSNYSEDAETRKLSKKAIWLEIIFYILFGIGAVLMVYSVKSLL